MPSILCTVVIWVSSVCGSSVTEIVGEVPGFFAVFYWAVGLAI